MPELYEIQKGVAISHPGFGRWQRLVLDMEPGDSVLVANENEAIGLSGAIKKMGDKATTRSNRNETENVMVTMIRQARSKKI